MKNIETLNKFLSDNYYSTVEGIEFLNMNDDTITSLASWLFVLVSTAKIAGLQDRVWFQHLKGLDTYEDCYEYIDVILS